MNQEKRAFWMGVISVFLGIVIFSLLCLSPFFGVMSILVLLIVCDLCDEVNSKKGGRKDGSK